MRFFKRNETAYSKFVFKDVVTGEAVDVINPQYSIVYYSGTTEQIVVPVANLSRLSDSIGEYVCAWDIPADAIENITYFVKAKAEHPTNGTTLVLEDFYRVISEMFFGNSSSSGMVIKFTKP